MCQEPKEKDLDQEDKEPKESLGSYLPAPFLLKYGEKLQERG